jgi:hypothetical protein
LETILDADNRKIMLDNYHTLSQKLGGIGASERTAKLILESFK